MGTVSSESPKVQYSVQREQSDGSLNRISVRVPYFSKDDIHVYVDDVEINSSASEQSTYTWRWDGDYIAITPNVASGSEVLVRRITPINEAIHIFDGRSEFDDQSMDENFQQLIYIAQEYSEGSGIKDVFSDINMHGYKITNVGWATDDDDVVTYGQYKKDAEGAKVAMQKAETASAKAEQHEQNTQAIANKAQTDITASKEAAITEITDRIALEVDKAKTHAVTAQSAAGTAVSASNRSETILQHVQVLEDEVELHVGTAEAAKDEAIRIRDLAKAWATKLNATVDGSEYSAKHYANEAKEQVSLATQQATLATTKASEADASAKNASASASTATTQATNASNSAKAAKLSADNAALSKTAAGTSEANAKASEVEAKKQADLAKGYANQATSGQVNADWNETVSTSKAFIKNKPTLGALASKDSIAYSEITGTPPAQDLSGLATKSELQTGLAGKANASHTHTTAQVTGLDTALAGKAPSSHTHPISQITNLQASLDAKTNDATLQVDLTAIRESITNVSSKVDGIGDTLSPTYAKKQAILDACDKALNGTNPVNAVDPTFINQLAEKLSKLGTVRPLGFHYLHPYGTVPADSIICNGATYSRALYKDFFDYITTQGWVKTEAEWQEIATRDNGFCPFYSDGDDSTNFRTPKFAPYQQIAITSASVGKYHQAGIPNIVGKHNGTPWITEASGCFQVLSDTRAVPGVQASGRYSVSFDASLYSPIYGRSDTVQPEAHSWVMCVVAYGVATNVGSVDIQNVMSAVNAVQAQVGEIPTPKVYATETWHSGTSWYRVWSDGFIEQGGDYTSSDNNKFTITLNRPMTTTYYHCTVTGGYNTSSNNGFGHVYGKTTSDFKAVVIEPRGTWEVRGY